MKSRKASDLFVEEMNRLQADLKAVPAQAQALTIQEARKATSGTVSLSRMRQLGHPFSSRHGSRGSGALPLSPINKHEGSIYNGWKSGQDAEGLTVENDSPIAIYVNSGTKKMIKRDFITPLQDFAERQSHDLAQKVVDKWNGE